MTSLQDSLTGSLLGLALGDALGFVVEAAPAEIAREYVEVVLRRGRAGERHHPHHPFGQYSDDTQLARELLLSIVESGGWHPARFAARVAGLVLAGRDVGAGPGTRGAGMRLLLGAPWSHVASPPPYAGNGTAMRVAPVGALYARDEARWRRCAGEQSRVTHGDPRCTAGALAVAGAAALAARPGPIDAGGFAEQLAAWVETESRELAASVRALPDWLRLPPALAALRVEEIGLGPGWSVARHGISPFVLPSVVWSLYAFLRTPDDWWEVVCTAIEVGGDTDTTAAMAGGIAGARLGGSALPPLLLARLTDRGEWDAAALTRLAHQCATGDQAVDSLSSLPS